MTGPTQTSYDELPYTAHPLHAGHPENLACKAILHGLQPPDVRTCRYLELGCSTGGHLTPLAQLLPEATFVGLDYAARQIERGQATIAAAGLKNVTLRAIGFGEADASLGQFDYIVCHGVYSWVAPQNQRRILQLINELLSPQGVAYVSYNTYPGWHLRGLIRDLLLRQMHGRGDAEKQVAQARNYLEFLANHAPDQEGVYARLLRQEVELLRRTPDTYLFHEHLEDVNLPVYFSEFIERAKEHGLQFLNEASYSAVVANLPAEVTQRLDSLARDRVEYEQQLDFLCNGTFRRTLLCRAGLGVSANPSPQGLTRLRLASRAEPTTPQFDVTSTAPAEFTGPDGAKVTTTHPLTKGALVALRDCRPKSMAFDELFAAAAALTKLPADPVRQLRDRELLAATLLRCHECGLLETHAFEPPIAHGVADRPVAFAAARFQAAHGESVSNLRHRIVDVNEVDRYLIGLLDGARDRSSLAAELVQMTRDGVLVLERNRQPVQAVENIQPLVQRALDASLFKLADLALLIE